LSDKMTALFELRHVRRCGSKAKLQEGVGMSFPTPLVETNLFQCL